MKTGRRSFLKIAGISAAGLLAGLSGEAAAQIAPGRYVKRSGMLEAKRWAMVIDARRFRTKEDCAPCIAACNRAHNVPDISGPQNVKWIWTDAFEHVFPDEMNEHLPSQAKERPYLLLCNHCTNPPCVRVCPTQATYKMADGIVAMDYHRCIGCRFCMAGCPYGARSFNFVDPRKYLKDLVPNPEFPTRMIGVVEKCNFCVERLSEGRMPACVEASGGRILFGDLEDPESDVRQALAANFSIRRKPSLGTQPGVYYLI